jgi:hypothetical protein
MLPSNTKERLYDTQKRDYMYFFILTSCIISSLISSYGLLCRRGPRGLGAPGPEGEEDEGGAPPPPDMRPVIPTWGVGVFSSYKVRLDFSLEQNEISLEQDEKMKMEKIEGAASKR